MNRLSYLGLVCLCFATQALAELPYGEVNIHDPATQIPKSVRPLFEQELRDTQICTAPDGWYYLTGTSDGVGAYGINVWKSKDLKKWEPLGLVVDLDKMKSWIRDYYVWPKGHTGPGQVIAPEDLPIPFQRVRSKDYEVRRSAWANEIHYIASQETFFIVGSMNHNIWTPAEHHIGHKLKGGIFVLRSVSGKAEGPYEDIQPDRPLTDEIDASLFVDDDGAIYLVYQDGKIARMKDDMTGLAENPQPALQTPYAHETHKEGAFLFKAHGKYHLSVTRWCFQTQEALDRNESIASYMPKRGLVKYSYDPTTSSSDSVKGPYGKRYTPISGGGHGNFFKDHEGNWWACVFNNPVNKNNNGFKNRPVIVAMKWVDGELQVDKQRTDAFYGSFN